VLGVLCLGVGCFIYGVRWGGVNLVPLWEGKLGGEGCIWFVCAVMSRGVLIPDDLIAPVINLVCAHSC